MTRLPYPFVIPLAYLLFVALTMVIRPSVFINYFIEPKAFFDIEHYVNIATTGYTGGATSAFYPLWPLLIRVLTAFTQSHAHIVLASGLLAFAIFLTTLKPLKDILLSYMPASAAWAWTALYALNPNSLFHALGYSESLCSLLLLMYLHATVRYFENLQKKYLLYILGASVLLAVSRPLLPVIFACVTAAGILRIYVHGRQEFKSVLFHTGSSLLGAMAGYSFYGYYNWVQFGSFWLPFEAQKHWDRKVGLHWEIIHSPSSVSGSDNILVWDIQAFYVPILVVCLGGALLWLRRVKPSEKLEAITRSYLFWFCSFFAFCHSMIAFLTYDKFMSLGRHVWATPAIFVALAILAQGLPKNRFSRYFFRFYMFGSCVYFMIFWARLARMAWIG